VTALSRAPAAPVGRDAQRRRATVLVAVLTVTWLAAGAATQVARGGAKNVGPESHHPRDRVAPIWTDHLKVTTYPSDAVAAPGGRTSLVLEIQPGDGMHVYAPGAEGYKVIALTVAPQPFVRVVPLQYPESEIYVFAPLNERVPVYQQSFTLRQELVLDDRPEARAAFRGKPSLTVTGTLSYQACDDKVCFNPVTVPLSWTLPLESTTGRR
jgi:DsbC/DsbD-like thiol-disulfide interchange protein